MNTVKPGLEEQLLKEAIKEGGEEFFTLLEKHREYWERIIPMIASESFTLPKVVAAIVFGQDLDEDKLDELELLAEQRCRDAFDKVGDKDLFVDLRSPSGAAVNLAVQSRMLGYDEELGGRESGIKMYTPDLSKGMGHLTHGAGEDRYSLSHLFNEPDKRKFLDILSKYGFDLGAEATLSEERTEELYEALEEQRIKEVFHSAVAAVKISKAYSGVRENLQKERDRFEELDARFGELSTNEAQERAKLQSSAYCHKKLERIDAIANNPTVILLNHILGETGHPALENPIVDNACSNVTDTKWLKLFDGVLDTLTPARIDIAAKAFKGKHFDAEVVLDSNRFEELLESTPEKALEIRAVTDFLHDLHQTDREAYHELFDECEEAAEDGLPNLRGIRKPGNPTAVNQVHDVYGYKALEATGEFDYDEIAAKLLCAHPPFDVIIIGGSANPRDIDYKKVIDAAKESNTLVWLDCAHYTGLITGGAMEDPVLAGVDMITTTTHKSPQGMKGSAFIANRDSIREKAERGNKRAANLLASFEDEDYDFERDSASIAGHAALWKHLDSEENETYAHNVKNNAFVLADEFKKLGWNVVTDGTESHIVLLNCKDTYGIDGATLAKYCAKAGIIFNKNGIPGDKGSAVKPDGIRMGTVGLTALGATPESMREIARIIDKQAQFAAEETRCGMPEHIKIQDEIKDRVAQVVSTFERPDQSIETLESTLANADPELYAMLNCDVEHAFDKISTYVAYLALVSLQTKYAEGYPASWSREEAERFYEGNWIVDLLEEKGNRLFQTLAKTKIHDRERRIRANTQSPNSELAILALLRGVANIGDKVIFSDPPEGAAAMIYKEYQTQVMPESYKAKDLIQVIEEEKPRVLFVDTKYFNHSSKKKAKKQWAKLRASADAAGTILIADNTDDIGRVIDGEIVNPLDRGYVDIMMTSTSDVDGPQNAIAILWDELSVRGQISEELRTLIDDIEFAVFPGTIGGPDLVAMFQMYDALAAALNDPQESNEENQ